MSKRVKLTKEVEVEVDINVWEVRCSCDRESLDFTVTANSDGDLFLEVVPCQRCIADAEAKGEATHEG